MSASPSAHDGFDPYHKWLGIRPGERPITHYRLLGLSPFEDDADVISDAADRQMAHVRNYQTGKYSALSQRVLNELSAAKLCLLNAAKKQAYDAELKAAEALPAAPLLAALPAKDPLADLPASTVDAESVVNINTQLPQAGGLPMPLIAGAGAIVGLGVLGLVLMLAFSSGAPVAISNLG